jgi:hypothetical protein
MVSTNLGRTAYRFPSDTLIIIENYAVLLFPIQAKSVTILALHVGKMSVGDIVSGFGQISRFQTTYTVKSYHEPANS